nr:unnamed protein product [Naegleria fowleri]
MISFCSSDSPKATHGSCNPFDGSTDMSKHFNVHALPNIRIHTKHLSSSSKRKEKSLNASSVLNSGIRKKSSSSKCSNLSFSTPPTFDSVFRVNLYNNSQPQEMMKTSEGIDCNPNPHTNKSSQMPSPHYHLLQPCTVCMSHSKDAKAKKIRTSISIQELLNA